MVFEICAAIATIVFAVVAYFLIQSLRQLQQSLKKFNDVTTKLESKIDPLEMHARSILESADAITDSVHAKLNAFNPLFNSIHQAARVVEEKTNALTEEILPEKKHSKDSLSNAIELVATSVLLWQQMKKRRHH